MNIVLSATLAAAKVAAAKHLCVAETALHERLVRTVAHLAEALAVEVDQALEQLGRLTLRELCLVLAEGPSEQARALLLPEQVNPHVHQGLSGHGAPPGADDNPANDEGAWDKGLGREQ